MKRFRNLRDHDGFTLGLRRSIRTMRVVTSRGMLRASGRATEERAGCHRASVPKRAEILIPETGVLSRAEITRRSDERRQHGPTSLIAAVTTATIAPFLIGTPNLLETELTHSKQRRKHFLIGTIRPCVLQAHSSLLTNHHSFFTSAKICPRRTPGSASGTR